MIHSMNTYASSSNNPYARKYLTKGRKNSDSFNYLDDQSYLMAPKNKKIKRIATELNLKQHCVKSESYSLFNDDNEMQSDFNEFYEFDHGQPAHIDSYNYLNYNENQNIGDENSGLVDDSLEEYSIDFIDESNNLIIDNLSYSQYQDPPLYNGSFSDSQFVSPPTKSKRKQGIVGRPTLSSPQRLLIPDNVYSHNNNVKINDNEKYFTDNNHRVRHLYTVRNSNKRIFASSDSDESIPRGVNRSKPRILLKPSMSDYRSIAEPAYNYNPIQQDANEIAQREVANREFARNLVARAQRQGTVIDKNKIPHNVFQQEPNDHIYRSSLDHHSEVAEIKESEQLVSQPYTTTISIADSRKSAPILLVKKSDVVPPQAQLTASDILKQKWKAANRNQS